jgi:nucleoside-diphosphate-sugar epimerase
MTKETILITGANGQIGVVLAEALRQLHGRDAVITTDINGVVTEERGPFEILDVLDAQRMSELIQRYQVTQIYHLAAILSARGEQNPKWAWEVNIGSLFNVLEAAKNHGLRVFYPSTIAVFGANTPKDLTPQETVTEPATVYGISKAAGENWCQYYFEKYGVDVRSVRFPGIIGYQSLPGGGTTDYAVEIFHRAVQGEAYSCFLAPETRLPMLYMDDAIRGMLDLMHADADKLTVRTSYNLAGVSFTPAEVASAIQSHLPDFKVSYAPDFRQKIAESWPRSIDDAIARRDWGWRPQYDLAAMTTDMIQHLQVKLAAV